MPHYQSILNHYLWLEQEINQAAINGDTRRNQILKEAKEALSSEIEHSQIYENLAYIDHRIRYHADSEEQAAYELQDAANDPGLLNDLSAAAQYHSEDKEDATVEWKMLLDQLQAAEAAAGGVPA
jgi:prolyl oligopeptidase PreP (S9A serine peptidase family)